MNIKFSRISWKGNEGFYYSSYEMPKKSFLSDKTDHHKLYYHEIGTSQETDKIIFGGKKNEKFRYVNGQVTEDQKYLIVSVANTTAGNNLFIRDLSLPHNKFIPIIYMLGVLLLILPSFLSSNNKCKVILVNLSIWFAIILVLMTFYYLYQLFIS